MKLFVRAFAVCLVFAGATAATLSPTAKHLFASHQSATSHLPIPVCGPGVPTCDPNHPYAR
jgi:hypothetical protein